MAFSSFFNTLSIRAWSVVLVCYMMLHNIHNSPTKLRQIFITSSTLISAFLSVFILAFAGEVLHVYHSQRRTNPWWLLLWSHHFDDRGLKAAIGASVVVLVLDGVILVTSFSNHARRNIIRLIAATLATIAAAVELIYPAVLNQRAPATDTMQTWTCRWSDSVTPVSAGFPNDFPAICRQSKFVSYGAVPLFVLQMVVLGVSIWALTKEEQDRKESEKQMEGDDGSERFESWSHAKSSFSTSITAARP
ncbi:hypothetical protein K461DRAFT_297768 [Myriangium duriaei CBS 260.36]|uniref:Uncharacterized protein n=1 Tax=Myriangium duriaei CBS 260.36 TaxID=1168546 RepID=A0A9P4IQR6_9PEZI|nr:hypothetical protein K461DRAFT_297768 [Myriangium duriaei CBS 260.36]